MTMRLRRTIFLASAAVACAAATAVAAAPQAGAPERFVALCRAPASEAAGDCAHVLEIGPPNPSTVVILVGGASEGAAMLRHTGQAITAALPKVQVWAFERREQNLADLSGLRGTSPADYYLSGGYRQPPEAMADKASRWGLTTTLSDLRTVVLAARQGGKRRVLLGGHSWGATTALAYAAWDFAGKPGYQDLAGLILIDGGVHDAFAGEGYKYRVTSEDAARRLEQIASGARFADDLNKLWGLKGGSDLVPIDYQLAGVYALKDPHGPSALQDRLPKAMQPPQRLTNAALLGWLLDTHAPAADLQVHSGHFDAAETGVHDWVQTGPARLADVAEAFAGSRPAPLEWYWPRRLSLDLASIDSFATSVVTESLGLPIRHAREIDTPLYVFQTGITHGSIVEAAKWVVANSRITRAVYVSDDTMAHIDPLLDQPGQNRFLTTVVEFIGPGR
jgi:pimeloyl-ACP methyl ester carboxylesterase